MMFFKMLRQFTASNEVNEFLMSINKFSIKKFLYISEAIFIKVTVKYGNNILLHIVFMSMSIKIERSLFEK
jgi:hypothetical protein